MNEEGKKQKRWDVIKSDPEIVYQIQKALNCHPITAKILVNRNILTPVEAESFLNPSLDRMRSPFEIKDMNLAVRRIYDAVIKGEKILIFGDYDADGITAVTVLYEFLQYAGATVSYYIPHRIKEGYGFQAANIKDCKGFNLIITVDCGSGSSEAVKIAQELGIDVIITDHHNIPDIPPAVAVVNPKRSDCNAGFEHLAGVGVAFCVVICLRKYMRDNGFWKDRHEPNLKQFCDLVALGTVADVVPLINENRIFSKVGLEIINKGKRIGIEALIRISGIVGKAADVDDIAFRIAPRLNAAGRIDHADFAAKLLMTNDAQTAQKHAEALNIMNKQRQDTENKILSDIFGYIRNNPDIIDKSAIILSNDRWHEGIIGIAASRVVERFFRPVILIATKNGLGRGSGRSIPGVNLYKGLAACATDLEHFGGHALAAGLRIRSDNIHEFQKHFEYVIKQTTTPEDFIPALQIDHVINFDDISYRLLDEIESLSPFGQGNPEPLFMAENIRIPCSKIVGKNHRRMTLKQSSGKSVNAIHFNVDMKAPMPEKFKRIAFRLRWNYWNNTKTPQIIIEET